MLSFWYVNAPFINTVVNTTVYPSFTDFFKGEQNHSYIKEGYYSILQSLISVKQTTAEYKLSLRQF